MSTLYLDRRDLEISVQGRALILRASDERPRSVPLALIERVIITGANVRLTSGTLLTLAQRGITTTLLPTRSAKSVATLHGPRHNDAAIRLGQALRTQDTDFVHQTALQLVTAKVHNQSRTLQKLLAKRPDQRRPLYRGLQHIQPILEQLRHATLQTADTSETLATLRGHEGAAARAYFQALAPTFPPELGFKGRNRRPPKDPVNATLSLAYTLLHQNAVQALHAAGLDPHIGFYHQLSWGRESLAADLIEPLRPSIDRWVQHLFAQRLLRTDHFNIDQGACLLGKTGRSHFFPMWEIRARPIRRLLRMAAQRMAKAVEPLGNAFFTDPPEQELDHDAAHPASPATAVATPLNVTLPTPNPPE